MKTSLCVKGNKTMKFCNLLLLAADKPLATTNCQPFCPVHGFCRLHHTAVSNTTILIPYTDQWLEHKFVTVSDYHRVCSLAGCFQATPFARFRLKSMDLRLRLRNADSWSFPRLLIMSCMECTSPNTSKYFLLDLKYAIHFTNFSLRRLPYKWHFAIFQI